MAEGTKLADAYVQIIPISEGITSKIKELFKDLPDEGDSAGYKQGNKTNGVLALKELLLLAKAVKLHSVGMDKNGTYGKGTAKAVNTLLKKWGYYENGIAGVNFIKKLSDEITKKIK